MEIMPIIRSLGYSLNGMGLGILIANYLIRRNVVSSDVIPLAGMGLMGVGAILMILFQSSRKQA